MLPLIDKFGKKHNQYDNYVRNVVNLFEINDLSITLNDLENAISINKEKTIDLLRNVSKILEKLCSNKSLGLTIIHDLEEKSIRNYRSGINAYIKFLDENWKSNENWESKKQETDWSKYKEEANELYILAHQVNGTESLLDLLKVENKFNFVKAVLKESYFFSTIDAKERFSVIAEQYNNKEKMVARWTETYNSKKIPGPYCGKSKKDIKDESKNTQNIEYSDNKGFKTAVQIDEDGNRAVRELIKEKTGHKVSAGKDSTFQFYKISHIWGNAFDPRFFTSFWNIVLVPAWANDLLDKSKSIDELTILFQQAIKYICLKHYKMEEMDWKKIKMECPDYYSNDNILSIYNGKELKFKVFSKKKNSQEFAKTKEKTITIHVD